jgi:hypothetical protein
MNFHQSNFLLKDDILYPLNYIIIYEYNQEGTFMNGFNLKKYINSITEQESLRLGLTPEMNLKQRRELFYQYYSGIEEEMKKRNLENKYQLVKTHKNNTGDVGKIGIVIGKCKEYNISGCNIYSFDEIYEQSINLTNSPVFSCGKQIIIDKNTYKGVFEWHGYFRRLNIPIDDFFSKYVVPMTVIDMKETNCFLEESENIIYKNFIMNHDYSYYILWVLMKNFNIYDENSLINQIINNYNDEDCFNMFIAYIIDRTLDSSKLDYKFYTILYEEFTKCNNKKKFLKRIVYYLSTTFFPQIKKIINDVFQNKIKNLTFKICGNDYPYSEYLKLTALNYEKEEKNTDSSVRKATYFEILFGSMPLHIKTYSPEGTYEDVIHDFKHNLDKLICELFDDITILRKNDFLEFDICDKEENISI